MDSVKFLKPLKSLSQLQNPSENSSLTGSLTQLSKQDSTPHWHSHPFSKQTLIPRLQISTEQLWSKRDVKLTQRLRQRGSGEQRLFYKHLLSVKSFTNFFKTSLRLLTQFDSSKKKIAAFTASFNSQIHKFTIF